MMAADIAPGRPVDLVVADGTRLSVLDHGGDGPVTVVLAHGWTLDQRTWLPVARALLDGPRPVRLLTYDHRGHGRSDAVRRGTASIDQLADDLAEVLTQRTDGPVVLAGHSMGGMTMMALAERHPDLVRDRVVGAAFVATSSGSLVPMTLGLRPVMARLVAAGEARIGAARSRRAAVVEARTRDRADLATAPARARRAAVAGRVRRRIAPAVLRPSTRWLLLGDRPTRDAVDLTALSVAQCRDSAMVGFRPEFDVHNRAEALDAYAGVPTVVLGGARDRLTPVRHSRTIAAHLPDATLVVYAGAGHMVPLERVSEVAARIGMLVGLAVEAGVGR